jgi:Acyl carrier protein
MTKHSSARQFLADAIHADVADIPHDARIGSFARWDSLAHMHLLLSIERHLGRQLKPDEAVQIESLADVTALVEKNARTNV